jgi:hypothetical protein
MGEPIRKQSKKVIAASFRARSTTIMLATEPVMVKFPASVLAIASVSQPEWGLAKCFLRGTYTLEVFVEALPKQRFTLGICKLTTRNAQACLRASAGDGVQTNAINTAAMRIK